METATKFKILDNTHHNDIFTSEMIEFLSELHVRFNEKRKKLLAARTMKQVEFDHHQLPVFLPETKEI
ncbi:MAG: malate synthase A, partial [Kaistella sp.]|nr:malate synthase A [Kaistella sp.]